MWKRPRGDGRDRGRAGDRGQAGIEFAGLITLLLLVALGVIQLGIAGYAVQQAGTAARAAARAETYRESRMTADQAAKAATSDWLDVTVPAVSRSGSAVKAEAKVKIPSILPVFTLPDATRSVTMPRD
ncbi:TadE/TadG family type IV pilus assembly protein [Streptomyces corynorhini]|uniref:Pilus assembly protein n=1 Tax=Streptomyces corynorhini TaxID=2282652 RepID=A0A370B408_9ACTN|nr:TadE/TadG family type IV pilus assembly protein [Streptomyces corynorhini]RDG35402.1 pilus assembly protein [Streptomyces corynorhini]